MRYADSADPVITLTSGPVNAYPDVLRGLARTVLYDYDPAFQLHYERVVDKASKALRISGKALILHGEPVLGLEAAAASIITLRILCSTSPRAFTARASLLGQALLAEASGDRSSLQRGDRPGCRRGDAEAASRDQHRVRLPSRHAIGHDQSDQRDRQAGTDARRLSDRRCGVVLRRHEHPSRRLRRRPLCDRSQ